VARASSTEAEFKLSRAGADRVLSPYTLGGKRLAGMLLRPNVVDFLDFVLHSGDMDLFIEEVEVRDHSPFQGLTIGEARQKYKLGANILAIKNKRDNKIIPSPESNVPIEKGDLLITLGTKGQLRELEVLT
jgi:voltage-gated potassium channel